MSYSMQFIAENKAEAKATVASKFDAIVTSQPIHALDRGMAQAAADAAIDLLRDDDRHISVTVNGSVIGTDTELDTLTLGVTVNLVHGK